MLLIEHEFEISVRKDIKSLLSYFGKAIQEHLSEKEIPVRFVVTESDNKSFHCEIGVLAGDKDFPNGIPNSIFEFMRREVQNTDKFNTVMIVPTGIGAELGGHAGDAAPAARLLAEASDKLITHPNVVNASDINEMPDNCLYVEGSVLSRLLMGTVGLEKVRSNRVIVVIDEHDDERISELAIDAVSATRSTLGLECPRVIKLKPPIRMRARYSSSGSAAGRVEGLERLCEVLTKYRAEFDAIGIASVIDVPKGFHQEYYDSHGKMINPWGGVEAMLTHGVSMLFDVPSAHAPMMENMDIANLHVGIVDPRMSAEAISTCFLHSVLKGLHRSPRIITDKMVFTHPGVLTAADVSCLVIPDGCVGLPTLAALEQGIPVIAVRENRNRMRNELGKLPFGPGKLFIAENYPEAVGIMTALKAGVALSSVRRPLAETKISRECAKSYTEKGSRVDDTVRIAKK